MNWHTATLSDCVKIAREIADTRESSWYRCASVLGGRYRVSWSDAQKKVFHRWGITDQKLCGFLTTMAYIGELTEVRP